MNFSTPSFNPGPFNHELFNPGLFNHTFLKHGVEKFMVEKSGVEMSFNHHSGLSTLKKYQSDSMGLHEFFHHSAIVSCITLHIWKSVDCYFSNKVYRDILRNSYVPTKTLKCLCTLYLKNSNLQIFIHEKLCMKL